MTGKSTLGACCCHCATTCKTGVVVECRCHHGQAKSQDNNDSENDSFTDDTTEKDVVLQVPQVSSIRLVSCVDCVDLNAFH